MNISCLCMFACYFDHVCQDSHVFLPLSSISLLPSFSPSLLPSFPSLPPLLPLFPSLFPPFLPLLPLFSAFPPSLLLPPSLPPPPLSPPRRPYFTYWLMFVHIVIMIISLSVYGFAPYGWDRFTESRTIRQSNLAFETTRRNVIPSVWGGPRQMDLVLLGALYAPCMRRDRQLFGAIDGDIRTENTSSGCCVRRDESGCVQVEQSDCPVSPCRSYISLYYSHNYTFVIQICTNYVFPLSPFSILHLLSLPPLPFILSPPPSLFPPSLFFSFTPLLLSSFFSFLS